MVENMTRQAGAWREYHETGLSRPLAAALDAFVEQGYHGASIREIAARAELSVPGLYHHYPSKRAMLMGLVNSAMDELLARCAQADREAGERAGARFDSVVESLLRFHMARRELAFIASTEMRAMTAEDRAAFVARRDEQQRMLDAIVASGVASGEFATAYPADAARAVATMCVAVSTWFDPRGALTPDELVLRYLDIARGMVRAPGVD